MSNVPPPPPGPPPPPPGSTPPPPPPPPPPYGSPAYGTPIYGSAVPPYGSAVPQYGSGDQRPVRHAGWWRRVGATIIDGLVAIPFYLPGVIALLAGPRQIETCTNLDGEPGLCRVPTGGTIALAVLLYVVGLVAYVVIQCRMLGKGATIGRKAMGYRVLDQRTMQPIGTGRAVGRFFATYLSALPCYLGFLWPLWDAEQRTFHDMIVGTRAVID